MNFWPYWPKNEHATGASERDELCSLRRAKFITVGPDRGRPRSRSARIALGPQRLGPYPGTAWVTVSSPVVALSEIVSTAELVFPEELVPVTLHDVVVGLLVVQMTVTPVKPLVLKYFTRAESIRSITPGFLAL